MCTLFDLHAESVGSHSTSRPKGTMPVSPSDRDIVAANGLAVVECSWARLDDVPFNKIASPHERLCTHLLLSVASFGF